GACSQRRLNSLKRTVLGGLSMKSMMLGASLLALGLAAPAMAHAETACADLAKTALPHAQVLKAVEDKVGDVAVCKVDVASHPTKDSDIRLAVWIPQGSAWNGKYLQLGNGGFAGAVPVGQFGRFVRAGYAVSGTDDGHQSTQ